MRSRTTISPRSASAAPPTERIDGRPSLMLEPRTGDTLAIASVAQSGVIAEIAERLAALQLGDEGGGGSPSCCRC